MMRVRYVRGLHSQVSSQQPFRVVRDGDPVNERRAPRMVGQNNCTSGFFAYQESQILRAPNSQKKALLVYFKAQCGYCFSLGNMTWGMRLHLWVPGCSRGAEGDS